MRKIYEWVDRRGPGVISDWGLQEEQLAKLEEKAGLLRRAEVNERTGKVDLPQNLLSGPMRMVYKLKIKGRVALRPILCLGPIDRTQEWTFLARAKERDGKTIPENAEAVAETRRQEIIADSSCRRLLWEESDDPTS